MQRRRPKSSVAALNAYVALRDGFGDELREAADMLVLFDNLAKLGSH